MEYAIYALYAIVAGLAIYAASQMKAPKTRPASLDEFNIPTAEEGREYPVLYGTDWFTDPNVVWYGDLGVETETESHVKTRKYSLGLHMEFFQGQADALLELRADDRTYFSSYTDSPGTISIDEPNLFGGKRDRGGIVGDIDVLFGEEDQEVNDYLLSVLPGPIPAMRGVTGLIFRQVYMTANNPFVAPHSARWSRVYSGWKDNNCWYPEKVEIPCNCEEIDLDFTVIVLLMGEDFVDSSQFNRPVDSQSDEEHADGMAISDAQSSDFGSSFHSDGASGSFFGNMLVLSSQQPPDPNDGPPIAFTGKLTMEGWVFPESGCEGTMFGMYDHTTISGTAITVRRNASGYVEIVKMANTVSETVFTSDDTIPIDYWSFVRVTRDADDSWHVSLGDEFGCTPQSQTFTLGGLIIGDFGRAVVMGRRNGVVRYDIWTGYVDRIRFTDGLARTNNVAFFPPPGQLIVDDSGEDPSGACPDPDMNPAHVYYDVITNDMHGMNRPIAEVDDDSFRVAADTFRAECFGVTVKLNRQGTSSEFMHALEEVTDSVCDIDPISGLWYCTPIRADYDPDDLPTFDESNIVAIEDFTSHAYGNLVSRVIVKYKDPDTAKPAETRWDNPATYGAQGSRLVIDTFQAPQIRRHKLAARICAREGKKRSHELRAFTAKVNRDGYGLRRGSVVKIFWDKLGMAGVICRVIAVNYGNLKNREIKLALVEDIYGLPDSSYIEQETSQWVPPSFTATPLQLQAAFELPRWYLYEALGYVETDALDDDVGYGMAIGARTADQGLLTGYDLWHNVNSGTYTQERLDCDFVETAVLDGEFDSTTAVEITFEDSFLATFMPIVTGSLLAARVKVGDLLLLVDAVDTGIAEFVRVASIEWLIEDKLLVTRGHLDTTPKQVWPDATVIYRMPESGVLQDDEQYVEDDDVGYALLTTTSQQVLDIDAAIGMLVTMEARAFRPIPPASLMIVEEGEEGVQWPSLVEGPFHCFWIDRNRFTQTDEVIQTQSPVEPELGEEGVTYNAYAYNDDNDMLIDSATGITSVGSGAEWNPDIAEGVRVRIEVESERDGYVSFQRQIRTFNYLTTSGLRDSGGRTILDSGRRTIQES